MLIAYLEEIGEDGASSLSDLEEFYRSAKKRFDEDEEFANRAREYVVKLQSGDNRCLSLWKRFIDSSLRHCEVVYDKLGVKLTKDDVRAESFYNPKLPSIVEKLEKSGDLVESSGAKCVFVDGFDNPLIIQKSDGGFLYATTDLAGLEFRANELKADRICYVVDARQSDHFKQVFSVAKNSNLVPEDIELEHIAFGTMMDKSGRPFKTRDGGTVKLIDLLDEAIKRAKETIQDRDISNQDLEKVAKAIGIGAVKYADLSVNRESNYIFSWDKMLSLDGNTALYIQYAYARIKSIFRRYGKDIAVKEVKVGDDLEKSLALTLLKFEDVLIKASNEATPNAQTYVEDYSIDDYIESCGGFSPRANRQKVLLVKKSGRVLTYNSTSWWDRVPLEVEAGDSILVLGRVDSKNIQITSSITEIIYQIAVSASVVLRVF